MCPMRFILVFFSAILAGYLAWRTVKSAPDECEISWEESTAEKPQQKSKQRPGFTQMIHAGFWGFVDMASGMYLWRNLRGMKNTTEEKQSSS